METKDFNSIGLAYLQVAEKMNIEAKKNHANALHKNQKALDVHSHDDEDHNENPDDGDGDIDAADLKKLRQDADKDDKKFDKKASKKKTSKDEDDGEENKGSGDDDQEKIKEADTCDKCNKAHDGACIGEEIVVSADSELQEGAARQAAFANSISDYAKEIGKDHMDHDDFIDHAKLVKSGNTDKWKDHADDQDTEVREKVQELAIKHLGQGTASEIYANKGSNMSLNQSYSEETSVDDVLALIDQGYTLDKAEAMVAEECGTVNASRKQPKAGENDKNIANNQRALPVSGKDNIPVRPGTKQQQRDFDKAARMAKSKDKVSVAKAPWDTNESVMDRISNMVEDIRKDIQEETRHKPTAIHHSTPVTAAQANDEQTKGRAADGPGARSNVAMTEKEFVEMHTVPTEVDPRFDGNVAAKKTAEAIKEKPMVSPTPNIPTSKGDSKIMPDPTPYGGPAVKTESYMDKYVNYIKGDK